MISRRSFLALPLLVPFVARGSNGVYRFGYEHVMGTSLDLAVRVRNTLDATRAADVMLAEIDRLCAILSTYDPRSEISRLVHSPSTPRSQELDDVLRAYDTWERRTGGAIASRLTDSPRVVNVDALGKAYVVDRTADAIRRRVPSLEGLLLNSGGDIVAWNAPDLTAIADPFAAHDNAVPLAGLALTTGAVATSGTYARGNHIIDPRSGRRASGVVSATVIAPDCVTANALATAMCVHGPAGGMSLIDATPGADALVVDLRGRVHRSTGFSGFERAHIERIAGASAWPAGFELTLALTLTGLANTGGFRRRPRRPYVAVWVEDTSGKVVRYLAVWGDRDDLPELSTFWQHAGHDSRVLGSITRATRDPGRYTLAWNGFDERGQPAPAGDYRIVVETNQQHGDYARQAGTITCAGAAPARIRLKGTANFDAIDVVYGPRSAA